MKVFSQLKGMTNSSAMLIFGVALIIRAVVLCLGYSAHTDKDFLTLTPDSVNYVIAAKTLMIQGFLAHSSALFYFPPGYPLFIMLHFAIFGEHAFPILLTQAILSSGTCVVVYLICEEVRLRRSVGLLAGILASCLVTSVSLSAVILSDTLYTFIFALSLLYIIRACINGNIPSFVTAGLLAGTATLIRPVGKYWAFAFAFVGASFVWLRGRDKSNQSPQWHVIVGGFLCACGVACLLPVPWLVRNDKVHGFPVLAITTISAPSTVAAKTAGDLEGKDYRAVQTRWERECESMQSDSLTTIEEYCECAKQKTAQLLRERPLRFLRAYLEWDWQNINERDYLLPVVVPQSSIVVEKFYETLKSLRLQRALFIFALAGLALLGLGGHWGAALPLAIAFIYSAIMIGAYPNQGSRYFSPGLTVGSIFLAVTGAFLFDMIKHAFRFPTNKNRPLRGG